VIFDLAREINTGRVAGQETDPKRRALVQLLDVLGLNLRAEVARNHQEVGPYVDLLVEVRRKLRDAKQWSLADDIRNGLTDLGVTVNDGPGGTSTWSIER
ncbi:MAG: cysteine--tRNA ligase, partial [Chloroflexi bacterium]|nr:cysteine--tRNA ligase [Chloroflexota bacterium]